MFMWKTIPQSNSPLLSQKLSSPFFGIQKKRKIIKVHTNPPSFPFHSEKVFSRIVKLYGSFSAMFYGKFIDEFFRHPANRTDRENCWFTCFSFERNGTERSLCALLMPFGCYCFSFITLQSKQLFWAFLFCFDAITLLFSHMQRHLI